jgi:hypothetical protein
MKPRTLKPITELDPLTEAERDQLWADLHAGLAYNRAVRLLGAEHFIAIHRHRLIAWYQRELLRRGINDQLAGERRIAAAEFLQLLNGQTLPWSALMHARILRAAFLLTEDEEQTPAKLLALQRIANNEFHQHIATEKLQLEKRRQTFRERTAIRPAPAANPRNPGTPSTPPDHEDIGNKPFRLWTAEEVAANQPKIRAAFAADPYLCQFLAEPEDPPLSFLEDDTPATEPAEHPTHAAQPASPAVAATPPDPSNPPEPSHASHASHASPIPAPTHPALPPLPTAPDAPFDVLHLKRVSAQATSDHISRDLSLPLPFRVNFYHYARYLEARAAQAPNWVGPTPAPDFQSQFRWCPCGQDTPCPDHGSFFSSFWEYTPEHSAYYDQLRYKNLPFTETPAALASQLRQREWELQHRAHPSNQHEAA